MLTVEIRVSLEIDLRKMRRAVYRQGGKVSVRPRGRSGKPRRWSSDEIQRENQRRKNREANAHLEAIEMLLKERRSEDGRI